MTKIILIALPTAILAFAAGVWASGAAVAEEFYPTEPPLAYSGWTMRYNDLLAACYQGNMEACDHVASDKHTGRNRNACATGQNDAVQQCPQRLRKIPRLPPRKKPC